MKPDNTASPYFQERTLVRNGRNFRLLTTADLDESATLKWRSFIGPRKIGGGDFLKAIRWGEAFPTGKTLLVTPYHSSLEKEIARIVLRKGGRIVIVLAARP